MFEFEYMKSTQGDQMDMREPRMAARRAHQTVNSGKTQSAYMSKKNKNAKNYEIHSLLQKINR